MSGSYRIWHVLSANKASHRPSHILYLDTETTQDIVGGYLMYHNFRLAVGIYRSRGNTKSTPKRIIYRWHTVDEVWQTIESLTARKTKLLVMAHNFRFDIQVLGRFGYLKQRGWECKSHVEDQGVFISLWRKDSRAIEFRDTMNYFKTSVAALGDVLGLPKLGTYDEHSGEDSLFEYCQRDVEILEKAMDSYMEFLDVNDLGNMKSTISAQSLSAYTHRFMRHEIEIHANESVTELERKAYRGGRTECFRIGYFNDQTYYVLDVNSMYPFVMSHYSYPTRLLTHRTRVTIDELRRFIDRYCVIATCTIETSERVFGVKLDGKLKFPIGTFDVTLCTTELQYALEHNMIKVVHECAVYDRADLFSTWVNEIYRLRQEYKDKGNEAYSMMLKLLMNSLYGKFGQKTQQWTQVGTCDVDDYYSETVLNMDTHKTETYRYQDGIVWKVTGSVDSYNTFVAIPAEVTANARMWLWRMIKLAGEDHVYYMDTDSLFVDQVGLNQLREYIDDNRLGYLKVEKQANELMLLGAKLYNFGETHKRKGIKRDAVCVGDEIYQQWVHLSRNEKIIREIGAKCVWKLTTKVLRKDYDKGIVQVDGYVAPIMLGTGDS